MYTSSPAAQPRSRLTQEIYKLNTLEPASQTLWNHLLENSLQLTLENILHITLEHVYKSHWKLTSQHTLENFCKFQKKRNRLTKYT